MRNYFIREFYKLLTGNSWKKTNCFFVLSTGRSGTATLAELLNLSPEIESYHEPPPTLVKERQSAFHEASINPEKYSRIFIKARSGIMAQAKYQNKIYAETSARMTFFAPAIKEICPNARFIHLFRHPGAVVRSGMRRKWYGNNNMLDKYRINPSADDPFFHEWTTASAFEKICWYWNAYNNFGLQFGATIPAERILLLKAEDLFKGKAKTLKRLYQFIGVECPSHDLIETVLKRKVNHQVKGQFPVFAKWEESDYVKLLAIAGKTMASLEYPLENG